MWNHGFDGGRVTISVPHERTSVAGFDCGSVFGDSAMIVQESELVAALAGPGAVFGQPSFINWQHRLACCPQSGCGLSGENSPGPMISLPVSYSQPTVTNIHTHVCVTVSDNDGSCSGADTTSTAQILYSDVKDFLWWRGLSGNYVVFGEINSDQNCDGLTQAMASQTVTGYRNSSLYANKASSTVLRVWNNEAQFPTQCYTVPTRINPPYDPFNP